MALSSRGLTVAQLLQTIGEHPLESNRVEAEAAAPAAKDERPERRAPPEPREVEPQGPPLRPGDPGPAVDPAVTHPVFSSQEARAHAAAAAAGTAPPRPSRGPGRLRRRAIGGIGGQGVKAGTPVPIAQRRDIIVGKFASEHQAQLDEEILALLREDS